MKILANDGISQNGIHALEEAGHEVVVLHVAQNQLENYINENFIDVLLVRSATKVRKALIDNCPRLKIIGRGGVGMDNIDVSYARSKGIKVINTPSASSGSVAELVFAHLFGGVRYLYDSNRNMPLDGDSRFADLKKSYSGGTELRGKTLGIVGFGAIAQEVSKLAIGCGMNVLIHRQKDTTCSVELSFFDRQKVSFNLPTVSLEELLRNSDFVSLHVPADAGTLIDAKELAMMKDGAGIINASRGGVVNEVALVEALDSGKIRFAGLDVFEEEPHPAIQVLMNDRVSLSPHIGGSTKEAQERIGTELAHQIIDIAQRS